MTGSLPAVNYAISTTADGVHKIIVEGADGNPNIADEAKKSPLFAVALAQHLAGNGDKEAQEITRIYQAYHRYFDTADNTELQDLKEIVLQLIPEIEKTLSSHKPIMLYPEQQVRVAEMELPHNAFPDLIKWKGRYLAAFREANSHVGYKDEGKIRILEGVFDAETLTWSWKNVEVITKQGFDLRDPRFFIRDDETLGFMVGGSIINQKDETEKMIPHVALFQEEKWNLREAKTETTADGSLGQWIWRVTWNPFDNHGYAFAYGKNTTLSLMKTADGVTFTKIADLSLPPLTDLSEGTIRFKEDGTAIALIRTRRNGIIATSNPESNYQNWTLDTIPFRLGGPNFLIPTAAKTMIAATRHYFLNPDNTLDEATLVCSMDSKTLTPLLRLQSQGDTSYPGMVEEEDGSITILYYTTPSLSTSQLFITSIKP